MDYFSAIAGRRVSLGTPAQQVLAEFTEAPAFAERVSQQYPGLEAQLSRPTPRLRTRRTNYGRLALRSSWRPRAI